MAEPAGGKKPPPIKDAQGKEIPINKLVDGLVKDVNDPPQLVVLIGFIGRSNRDGFVRIYVDLHLRDYYEVLGTDILFPEGDPDHPEAPSRVVVKASANVAWVQTAEASFFEGAIASAYPIESGVTDVLAPVQASAWDRCGKHRWTAGCPSRDCARCTYGCVSGKTGSHG
jgi:hypothetical protein